MPTNFLTPTVGPIDLYQPKVIILHFGPVRYQPILDHTQHLPLPPIFQPTSTEVCLLAGSVRNAYHTKYRTMFTEIPLSCQTVRKGIFAAGATFVLFNGIVSEFYYIRFSKARDSFQPCGGETGIGMGTYK
ncbi:hypothetical protein JHK86_016456 [Glycine max]|nr:hypothetical protein JHK86_016456 [Glycine max]